MFRKNAVTRSRQRMTTELNESLGHLRQAAKSGGRAAKETYVTAKPHLDKAVTTLAELPANGRKSAKKLRQSRRMIAEANRRAGEASLVLRGKKQRRWPLTAIALAGGLVIGGVASLLSKRLQESSLETHPAS
ncbi:hypothetical protein [Fodinicola acaciae]|uniref:hypothetical protein n=1 Tax=Fodinicola acaciae TaxID=2681555 RepID=UPI0013D0A11C|nr:hypothetical protein [Fodinicola acaciae]